MYRCVLTYIAAIITTQAGSQPEVWLGANDQVSEGNWVFTDSGTPFNISDFNWHLGRLTCV